MYNEEVIFKIMHYFKNYFKCTSCNQLKIWLCQKFQGILSKYHCDSENMEIELSESVRT